MKPIKRVMVANRGEIAVRVIRACEDLGIETVITFSEADKESLPVRMANRAVCIGTARSQDSYLKVNTIVVAALGTGCDAIHPGYGFLCEQPELPEKCAQYGLIFIGPTAENIRRMGDKILARKTAEEVGVQVTPGSELVQDLNRAKVTAGNVGYPLLLKAAAGGGGRGMVIVNSEDEIVEAYDIASAEAQAAFGDDRLYMEHYIRNARHIEIQVLGDHLGHVIHLGERDCSIQRRYQKILEESPSPIVSAELRERMVDSAIALTKHIHYEGAGTVEFIFDEDGGEFYFMEMNTRIQVEHPVTEMVSGVDLVKEQINLAAHYPLSLSQSEVRLTGHAIECRINAESPEDSFRPCPGRITEWIPPEGQGIRVDSHCYAGYLIPPYYDSLIAKVITKGNSRLEAIERMKYALDNFTVSGVSTTIPFHRQLLEHPDYVNGRVNTCWTEQVLLP